MDMAITMPQLNAPAQNSVAAAVGGVGSSEFGAMLAEAQATQQPGVPETEAQAAQPPEAVETESEQAAPEQKETPVEQKPASDEDELPAPPTGFPGTTYHVPENGEFTVAPAGTPGVDAGGLAPVELPVVENVLAGLPTQSALLDRFQSYMLQQPPEARPEIELSQPAQPAEAPEAGKQSSPAPVAVPEVVDSLVQNTTVASAQDKAVQPEVAASNTTATNTSQQGSVTGQNTGSAQNTGTAQGAGIGQTAGTVQPTQAQNARQTEPVTLTDASAEIPEIVWAPAQSAASELTFKDGPVEPEFTASVTEVVLQKADAGVTQFDIQLYPKELGKVTVNVQIDAGQMVLSFICESAKSQSILNAHAGAISTLVEQSTGRQTVVEVPEENAQQQQGQENYEEGHNGGNQQRQQPRPQREQVGFFIDQLKSSMMLG